MAAGLQSVLVALVVLLATAAQCAQGSGQIAVVGGKMAIQGPEHDVGYESMASSGFVSFDALAKTADVAGQLDAKGNETLAQANKLLMEMVQQLQINMTNLQMQIKDTTSTLAAHLQGNVSDLQGQLNTAKETIMNLQNNMSMAEIIVTNISVLSSGFCTGASASIKRNGVELLSSAGRSVYVVTFDNMANFKVLNGPTAFDVFTTAGNNSGKLYDFIAAQPRGSVVAVAVSDTAFDLAADQFLIGAMEMIGSSYIRQLKRRESFAVIGVKDAPIGSVLEDHGTDTDSTASPSDCTGSIFIPRKTHLLTQRFFSGALGDSLQLEIETRSFLSAQETTDTLASTVIRVVSGGNCASNNLRILQDDVQVSTAVSTGLNFLAFDPSTLKPVYPQRFFNTFGNTAASADLLNWISGLPNGTIVAGGVRDEGVAKATDDVDKALAMIGGILFDRIEYRESYAIVGVKGWAPGTAKEDVGRKDTRGLITNACSNRKYDPRDAIASAVLFSGRTGANLNLEFNDRASVENLHELKQDVAMHQIRATIEVNASAYCDLTNSFVMRLNGELVPVGKGNAPTDRGMKLVVVDPVRFYVKLADTFDTFSNTSEVGRFVKAIAELMPGDIAVVTTFDSAGNPINADVIRAMESIGSQYIRNVRNREPWGIIGYKGAPIGSVEEDHGLDGGAVNKTTGCDRPTRPVTLRESFYSSDIIEKVREYPPTLPRRGMELYVDANSYISGDIWEDLSGNGNDVNLVRNGARPNYNSAFGGFFNFSRAYTTVDVPGLNQTATDYSVVWCAVKAAGDEFGGISRGLLWDVGNHLIGWGNGAYFGDQSQARPEQKNFVRTGDNLCITHVNVLSEKAINVYINDEFYFKMPWASPGTIAPALSWGIGGRSSVNDHNYDGGISAIVLYSRALSSAQVKRVVDVLGYRIGVSDRSLPASGMVFWMDAASVSSTGAAQDLSGSGVAISPTNNPTRVATPTPYWNMTGTAHFKVSLPQLTSSYTVFWCGLRGSGDPYSGISRGDTWTAGTHLVGWQLPAVKDDVDADRTDSTTLANDDTFCVSNVNDVPRRMLSVYVNGAFHDSYQYFRNVATPWTSLPSWNIGIRPGDGGHNYDGGIVSVLIYNRILSPAENERLFNYYARRLYMDDVV